MMEKDRMRSEREIMEAFRIIKKWVRSYYKITKQNWTPFCLLFRTQMSKIHKTSNENRKNAVIVSPLDLFHKVPRTHCLAITKFSNMRWKCTWTLFLLGAGERSASHVPWKDTQGWCPLLSACSHHNQEIRIRGDEVKIVCLWIRLQNDIRLAIQLSGG